MNDTLLYTWCSIDTTDAENQYQLNPDKDQQTAQLVQQQTAKAGAILM